MVAFGVAFIEFRPVVLPALLLFAAGIVASCGSGDAESLMQGGGTPQGGAAQGGAAGDAGGVPQPEICKQYLDCLTELEPSHTGAAMGSYGPSGTCWVQGPEAASQCTKSCGNALELLRNGYPPPYSQSCIACVPAGKCGACTKDEDCSSNGSKTCELKTGRCLEKCGTVVETGHKTQSTEVTCSRVELSCWTQSAELGRANVYADSGSPACDSKTLQQSWLFNVKIANQDFNSLGCMDKACATPMCAVFHEPPTAKNWFPGWKDIYSNCDSAQLSTTCKPKGAQTGTYDCGWYVRRDTFDAQQRVSKKEIDGDLNGVFEEWTDVTYQGVQ